MRYFITFTAALLFFSLSLEGSDDDLRSRIKSLESKLNYEELTIRANDLQDADKVKKIIDEMFKLDQEVRLGFTLEEFVQPEVASIVESVDRFHTKMMKEILSIHRWISTTKFGEKTNNQAFTLIQHADRDPFFQAGCLYILFMLEPLNNRVNNLHYAYLYDRVMLNVPGFGGKQRHGTQLIFENGSFKLRPYEGTREDVEKWRAKSGLEPLDVYIKRVEELYKAQK